MYKLKLATVTFTMRHVLRTRCISNFSFCDAIVEIEGCLGVYIILIFYFIANFK